MEIGDKIRRRVAIRTLANQKKDKNEKRREKKRIISSFFFFFQFRTVLHLFNNHYQQACVEGEEKRNKTEKAVNEKKGNETKPKIK